MKKKKIREYLFNDEFEIKGVWMRPGSDLQVAGILIYSNEQIRLELFDTIGSEDPSNKTGVIWGVTETGEEISLFSAFRINFKSHMGKYSLNFETYRASQIFVGMHCVDLNKTNFYAMEIEFSYLPEWLGETVFKTQGSEIGARSIRINEPELILIDIPYIDAKLKGSGMIRSSNDQYRKAEFTSVSTLKLVPNESRSFEWFEKQLNTLQKLMTVLTGRGIYILDLIFTGDEIERNELMNKSYSVYNKHKLFIRQRPVKLETKITEDSFILSYKNVKSNFGTIVNKWFESEEKMDVVYDLFTGEYFGITHTTKSFSNLMQSIEAFHRRNYPGTLIESNDFDLYLSELNNYIKDTAPSKLKDKLMGSVKYSNELSLRKRLIELTNSLSLEARELIFGDEKSLKKFIQKLVNTRNYLTHYDQKGSSGIIETENRIFAIQRLKAFMTILIFKELGIKEEEIIQRFKDDYRMNFQLSRANMKFE